MIEVNDDLDDRGGRLRRTIEVDDRGGPSASFAWSALLDRVSLERHVVSRIVCLACLPRLRLNCPRVDRWLGSS